MSQNPGWYPSNGQMRWWDGERWTQHVQAMPTAPVAVRRKSGMPTWAKVTGGIIGGFVAIGVIGSAMSGGSSSSSTTLVAPADQTSTSTSTAATKAAAPKASTPKVAPADTGTASQQNALRSAESYISYKGFSRLGLIDQLSSEYADGFSKADATWAVDHLDGIDWNEQAVKAGKSYLDLKGFSRSGLIQQLSSSYADKFTKAQATHAADALGLK